jgi:DNA gyrase subunit B
MPTRCRAASTASASRWSTRSRNGSISPSGATARSISCASATATPRRRWRSSARRRGKKGTRVTFLPSAETFKITEFDWDKLEHRFRELAFLNSGVRLILSDARHEEEREVELFYEGGIGAFVRYLDRAKTALIPDPISVTGQRDDIGIDVALEWNDSYYEQVLCFTNNIPQRDGGTHLAAFRAALTRTLNNYAERRA